MTTKEQSALRVHNSMFTKQADKLSDIATDHERSVGITRFKVIYFDGKTKFDFECGSFSRQIHAELV